MQMQRDIAEQLRMIPSVTSVAFATALPMERELANDQPVTAEDKAYSEGLPPLRRTKFVSPGLFETLGTPLVAGRDFTWADIQPIGTWRSCQRTWRARCGGSRRPLSASAFVWGAMACGARLSV